MRFRPSLPLTLALAVLAALFLRLGLWQVERRAEKLVLFEQFNSAPERGVDQALANEEQFARVEAYGHYDPDRHILLDNRIWKGRAGIHVLTPFTLVDGRTLLVNRGWLPLAADRRTLPEFATDAAAVMLRGRLVRPTTEGLRLGPDDALDSDQWPQLVTYLDLPTVGAALGEPLMPWLLLLDEDDPGGFEDRQWSPAVMTPEVHQAYAVQWFALSAATVIIWLALGFRRGLAHVSRSHRQRPSPGHGKEQE